MISLTYETFFHQLIDYEYASPPAETPPSHVQTIYMFSKRCYDIVNPGPIHRVPGFARTLSGDIMISNPFDNTTQSASDLADILRALFETTMPFPAHSGPQVKVADAVPIPVYDIQLFSDLVGKQPTPAEIGAALLLHLGPGEYSMAGDPRFTLTVHETGTWAVTFKQPADPDQPTLPTPLQ